MRCLSVCRETRPKPMGSAEDPGSFLWSRTLQRSNKNFGLETTLCSVERNPLDKLPKSPFLGNRRMPPWRDPSRTWSEIGQENPLNLSISISGGKETNKDSPSNGE